MLVPFQRDEPNSTPPGEHSRCVPAKPHGRPAAEIVGTAPDARQLLGGLAFLGAFLLLFWPTLVWMALRFDAPDSFYSHGWLIPFASGWLVWRRRHSLRALPRGSTFGGLVLLIPALLVHVLATWWHVGFASGLAMVAAVWGVVWTLWGREVLWALRLPMLFLLFMVPLPAVLLMSISFKMKLLAAALASACLRLVGMSAEQAGSTIQVSGVSVVVDDTCSGLRSLISLMALAILWTTLLPPSARRWQKLALAASAIPLALVSNTVRIVVLVLICAIYGPQLAQGFIHYGSGIVVFGVSLLALAWLSRRLVV